ncbi:MAG: AgmX/PglI C-terminal domain-containing protein [Myxococcota bacterium]|nr:AgmX/PglI C-terminal domain-containing protein [Myxococcota bacterium]
MRAGTFGVIAVLAALGCGGMSEEVDGTVATVIPVRGETRVSSEAAAVITRVSAEETIEAGDDALARIRLDDGPQLLLDEGAGVTLRGEGVVELGGGRVFVEAGAGEQLEVRGERGSLRASDAAFSVSREGGGLEAYVVRGELAWSRGEGEDAERGIAAAGETLRLGDAAAVEATALWQDWTGGLARPGPSDAAGPRGVGTLEARVPDEVGLARWPLVVRRLDVRVRVEGDLAVTEVDQLFFNPASETVEGLYRVAVPREAVLQRFAVDRDDRLVDGYVREKAQARQAYERQVYRGSTEDPALLEWDAPGHYRARIYPIAPGETRRIVIRYAEWLRAPAGGAARLYRYPMSGGARAPHIQEMSISADVREAGAERVRAGMGAVVEDGAVRIRRSDFRPRSDFWLELIGGEGETQRAWTAPYLPPARAPNTPAMPNEADEHGFFYLPLVLPTSLGGERAEAMDLVVLADVSAATDRSHLELGRSVVESLTAHLGPEDRVAVVSADLSIRSVVDGEDAALGEATPERIERLLDGLARVPAGGATDLGAAIAEAAALLDPERAGAVVYVGDGTPTVGELQANGLLERLGRLPDPLRLYAVAVGSDANLELLEAVTRGGGLAMRVEERSQAADAALELLAHAGRPIAHQVTVELGNGIENAFPRRPMDAVLGEVFPVVGRVRDGAPTEITVRGVIAGAEFTETIPIQVGETEATTDLRLRWAAERLRQLLLDGGGREEVAELGTRYGLITPFTSYYVPSRRELQQMGAAALRHLDRPLLRVGGVREGGALSVVSAVALGPLAITGCALSASEEPAAEGDFEMPMGAREVEAASAPTPPEEPMADMAEAEEMADEEAPPPPAAPARQRSQEVVDPWGGAPGSSGSGSTATAAPMAAAEPAENAPLAGLDGLGDGAGDDALADQLGALGYVGGNDEVTGAGGLGLRGTGRGGGGSGEGTIGLGNLGTIGHGGGGGSGSGYGRGASRAEDRRAAVPRVRTGNATVTGALSREVIRRVIRRHINEVRFCYEQGLQESPELEGRVMAQFTISPSGAVTQSSIAETTLGDAAVESCIASAVRRWTFPAPDGGGSVMVRYPFVVSNGGGGGNTNVARPSGDATRVVTRVVSADHRRRRCSDAAGLSLDDRRALWRERLAAEGSAHGWVRLYRHAVRDCEARSWRDRRAFLGLVLGRAGSVSSMVDVYRLLSDPSGRSFVRAQILRRVRTPDDLRQVRRAFLTGSEIDWALVEQILDRAPNEAAKVRALRRLTWQYPDSFELKLRLLSLLERAERPAEAKRLADAMRADPLADPGVRTAIGEMFLRFDEPDEARRVFSEIVEFAPLDELARRRLGDLYRAHGWHEDAYRQYQTLAEIRPDDPTTLLLLAQAAAGAGRVDEALRLERRLMQTAEPGASQGVARTALLWSSVRYARLKQAARGDDERLERLERRRRRSGILREAGDLRVTLVWSHPDAQLGLWAGFPGLSPSRPTDLSPEHGLEAFHLEEQETGTYRLEVRRMAAEDELTEVDAQLVVIWNEGEDDERVELVDLHFDPSRDTYAWNLTGTDLTETR